MNSDPQDRLLESFLKELTRETRRPSFAPEILRKLAEQKSAGQDDDVDTSWDAIQPGSEEQGVPPRPDVRPGSLVARQEPRRHWGRVILSLALACGVLIAIGVVSWMSWPSGNGGNQEATHTDPRQPDPQQPDPGPNDRSLVDSPKSDRPGPERIVRIVPDAPPSITPRVPRDDVPADQDAVVLPAAFVRQALVATDAIEPHEAAANIDRLLEAAWSQEGVQPAGLLVVREWAVRLCGRLIGRPPTAAELEDIDRRIATSTDRAALRRELVQQFTAGDSYREEFADHWSRRLAWRLLGLSPTLQTSDSDMLRVQQHLNEAILNGSAWDEIGYSLISAVGSTDTNRPDYNPAASYWVGLLKRYSSDRPEESGLAREFASAQVSQVFLGEHTGCLQCHDSYAGSEVAQRRFWEFHAFFSQMRVEEAGPENYLVINRNHLPMGDRGSVSAPVFFRDSNGERQSAFPRFSELEPVDNGFVAMSDRRTELARFIAGSKHWRTALANHVWTGLLNVPLTGVSQAEEPDPLTQSILDELSEQFAANDFDLTWLVQTIALSRPFALGVGTEEQIASDSPYFGNRPRFSRFYHQQGNQRSPALSLAIVARAYQSGEVSEAASAGLLARIDGDRQEIKPRLIQEYLPDNDNQWAVGPAVSGQLDMIANSSLSQHQKVEHLIRLALGRPARAVELEQAELVLQKATNERTALQDIWWSLLNSYEYQLPIQIR